MIELYFRMTVIETGNVNTKWQLAKKNISLCLFVSKESGTENAMPTASTMLSMIKLE